MRRILCILIGVLLVFSFTGCENTGKQTIGKEESDVFKVETIHCTLKYPNQWKEKIEVIASDEIVSFQEKETSTPIFDIFFGGKEGHLLGVLTTKNESVEVRVVTYGFPKQATNTDELFAMQDDINVIINHLHKDYKFELGN